MNIKITTLIENHVGMNVSLCSEHGLSMFIQMDDQKNILFDTGSSGQFITNALKLGIDLSKIDYIILSHGHDDHTGGLKQLFHDINPTASIIVGESFFNDKYKLVKGSYVYDGNPFTKELLKDSKIFEVNNELIKLCENVYVLSSFTHQNDFELPSPKYCVKNDNHYEMDHFRDEVVLIIEQKKGLIVFVGCSHVGIINILESIVSKLNKPIYGVIGGTHLMRADDDRIQKTIKYFKEQNIKLIAFSHCTGVHAVDMFKAEFDDFVDNHTGSILEFND